MASPLFDSLDALFDDLVVLFDASTGVTPPSTPPPVVTSGGATAKTYRVLCADLVTNTIREELPISDLQYSDVLNAPGSMSGWISLDHPKCTRANLDPGATAIYIERGGLLVWGGILWTAQVDSVERKLQLGAEGFWSYFRHRLIRNRVAMNHSTAANINTYAPSSDVGSIGVAGSPDASQLFNNIDDTTTYAGNIAILSTGAGANMSYNARVNLHANDLAGLSIAGIRLVVVGSTNENVRLTPLLTMGTPAFNWLGYPSSSNPQVCAENAPSLGSGGGFNTPVGTMVSYSWSVNPQTGQPWTSSDVEAFGSTNAIGFTTTASSFPGGTMVGQMWLEVSWGADGTAIFNQVDQLQIAQDLVRNAQAQGGGDLGVSLGAEVAGVTRDITYHDYERKNLGEALEELAALLDGFDFSVDVAWDATGTRPVKTLKLYYPTRGSRLDIVFNHNVAGTAKFQNAVDGTTMINLIDIIGTGDGSQMLISTASDTTELTRFLLMEGTVAAKDVNDKDFLDAMAQAQLGRRRLPRETPGLEMQALSWPEYGTFHVGDEALVVTADNWLTFNAYHRVQSITMQVGNEGQEMMIPGFVSSDADVN